MKRVEVVDIGDLVWVKDDKGALKLIIVQRIIKDLTPDLEGWNIICQGEEYFLECCFELEYPIEEN